MSLLYLHVRLLLVSADSRTGMLKAAVLGQQWLAHVHSLAVQQPDAGAHCTGQHTICTKG